MDTLTFRRLGQELASTHRELAKELGMSEVSVKRMATGAQVITEQTARQLISRIVVLREGHQDLFDKLLAEYHRDTLK